MFERRMKNLSSKKTKNNHNEEFQKWKTKMSKMIKNARNTQINGKIIRLIKLLAIQIVTSSKD